jgi:hypothetical protein
MKSRILPPHVYHMAEVGNWRSIQTAGLLPATELVRNALVADVKWRRLVREQRPEHTVLPDGVAIRDQKRIPPTALQACLVGLSPAKWYALLNGRVFFWFDPERLNRHRNACPRPQIVMTLNACALIEAYRDFVSVTPINSGNALRKPAKRGAATFVPYDSWLASGWTSEAKALRIPERSQTHRPVELTIEVPVPDIMSYVVAVQELAIGDSFDQGSLRATQSVRETQKLELTHMSQTIGLTNSRQQDSVQMA